MKLQLLYSTLNIAFVYMDVIGLMQTYYTPIANAAGWADEPRWHQYVT